MHKFQAPWLAVILRLWFLPFPLQRKWSEKRFKSINVMVLRLFNVSEKWEEPHEAIMWDESTIYVSTWTWHTSKKLNLLEKWKNIVKLYWPFQLDSSHFISEKICLDDRNKIDQSAGTEAYRSVVIFDFFSCFYDLFGSKLWQRTSTITSESLIWFTA